MTHVLVLLLGAIGSGICVHMALHAKRWSLNEQKRQQAVEAMRLREALQAIKARRQELDQQVARFTEEQRQVEAKAVEAINARRQELDQQFARFREEQRQFEVKAISYRELQDENTILKRDLQNIDVNLRKLELDRELQRERQDALDRRSQDLGRRFLKDNIKWISSSLTPNNFVNCKQRLQNVVEWCRGIGFDVPVEEETASIENLRQEFEMAVRAAFEREEQARIKARIREEQALEREIERELKKLDRDRTAIKAALEKAVAEAKDQYGAEIELLRARLAEVEEKSQRAISQAQLTKSGYVYVISNIGSLGEGVFKIGMTRRLEPMDRVKELGDASVPFPFDVHMMISSDDAPTLENALHRTLHKHRINNINPRKEFFKTDIEAIRRIVEKHHGEVQYVADAEALQYHQSLSISEEDQEFIESVYDRLVDGEDNAVPDDA